MTFGNGYIAEVAGRQILQQRKISGVDEHRMQLSAKEPVARSMHRFAQKRHGLTCVEISLSITLAPLLWGPRTFPAKQRLQQLQFTVIPVGRKPLSQTLTSRRAVDLFFFQAW